MLWPPPLPVCKTSNERCTVRKATPHALKQCPFWLRTPAFTLARDFWWPVVHRSRVELCCLHHGDWQAAEAGLLDHALLATQPAASPLEQDMLAIEALRATASGVRHPATAGAQRSSLCLSPAFQKPVTKMRSAPLHSMYAGMGGH